MSNRRYPPKEEWHGSPSSDRSIVGRRKIDELQRQIAAMETDIKGRSDLIHKLSRLQEIEREKRVLTILLTVIKHRTKEFSTKQQEAAMKAKQRLQEARRLVEEQRLALAQAQSPEGKPLFRFHNDKLYPRYEPYLFSEDRERRFKDSLPLPLQERDWWKDYHKQMLENNEVAVDDAVAAFQRLTKKPKPKKKWNLPLQYVPYFDRDYRTYMDIPVYYPIDKKDRDINDISNSSLLKVPKMANGGDGGKFKDTMKFTETPDQYRDSRKRDMGTSNLPDFSHQKSQHSNIQLAKAEQQKAEGKQMKIKYRATPAYFLDIRIIYIILATIVIASSSSAVRRRRRAKTLTMAITF
ncbi:hypothetical protein DPMN_132786 [Dreissena polymorpha]|uniref:Uncharacterized protein n=1 Tax=Dreissena polymorpha TaxID=45954 RepID=A0A9D4JCD1_DREPO|nr:hypothetical protein DPMN_132786 [Dreissena polymorpha]